ncbi:MULTISPECIES: DUF2889 domain-containing protein [unclassified Neptuniibacter]|jgi:hypothetical protein|uniref:DUF2889 domain-containing protein n=1 Tax=unclassified Neptuniibacter TaxID=2630693 RepID=UPI0026E204B8|nr:MULTISPECIES: DUF2889 domain-containing protein [unclassified Neptuniibacter]MDO6515170.1 DUF2889 domain-containing protein [Neptuniibacter sp. 2_MG-2023]MDO6592240.1 DUF2889 domain-containing protein [Neptuniibacter sp. 1_MG-2023]
MPLPIASARSLKHTRRVICEGFKREDGLWDIEAHLIDTKTFSMDYKDRENGIIPPGEPLHGMSVRITIDMDLNILDAVASMDYTPFSGCKQITEAYKQLIGLQIARGFTGKIKSLFSGRGGCTHLLELLGPLATTAFQATHQERELAENFWQDGDKKPPMLDTCHALAANGPVVKEYWPHFYEHDNNKIIPTNSVKTTESTDEF